MINLLPINKKVRDTLVKREMAVSRLSSNGRDILEPQSEDTLNLIANESMKSLWVKMFSVAEIGEREYRARLYGGEVFSEGGSYHESAGYSKIYGRRSVYDALGTLDVKPNELNRPLPGIIDFTCQYKGGLFAIRESTINWVAWDLEDLERLIPHFASPGKGVLLEWGYQSSFKNTVADNISEQEMKDGKAYTRINEMVLESGGTYDGMCGVISNFEWSLRDDGGFDCVTYITSIGISLFDGNQIDKGSTEFQLTSDASGNVSQVHVDNVINAVMNLDYLLDDYVGVKYSDFNDSILPGATNSLGETQSEGSQAAAETMTGAGATPRIGTDPYGG